MRDISIGKVKDINVVTKGVHEDEIGAGLYRPLKDYALQLTEYYLRVNKTREDKLREFSNFDKKDPSSTLFLMAIGGDEAPAVGTSYLISFLNCGKRIASSTENFLLFGANVKEDGPVVEKYVRRLFEDIQYLESMVHTVEVDKVFHKVEFKLAGLPNDLKNLSFLAGELNQKAHFFSTFGDVHYKDVNDRNKIYGVDWKPFEYNQRLRDAKKVASKKSKLPNTVSGRRTLTKYIADVLKTGQEFVQLVGEYIHLARTDQIK